MTKRLAEAAKLEKKLSEGKSLTDEEVRALRELRELPPPLLSPLRARSSQPTTSPLRPRHHFTRAAESKAGEEGGV